MPSARRTMLAAFATAIAAATAAGAALPMACTSDTAEDGTPTASGPAGLAIVSPVEGKCVPIGEGADAEVLLHLEVENVVLRPPGLCGGYAQCGHAVVSVNGVYNNAGAGAVLPVLMRKLADRFADLDIAVRLVNDEGEELLDPDFATDAGRPLEATVSITTKATCDEGAGGGGGAGGAGGSGGAGGGGAGGSGGAAGAGGSGGAAGAGGSGGAAGAGGSGGAAGAGGSGGAAGAGGSGGAAGAGGSGGAGGA